jgi:hypothetical protein
MCNNPLDQFATQIMLKVGPEFLLALTPSVKRAFLDNNKMGIYGLGWFWHPCGLIV